MPTIRSLEDRIDALESRAAIEELIHRYAHAIDHRDPVTLQALFHADARIDLGTPLGGVTGQQAIMAVIASIWKTMRETHHWISNIIITIDGDQATSTCAVHAVIFDLGKGSAEISGTYVDSFSLLDDCWRFSNRKFNIRFWNAVSTAND